MSRCGRPCRRCGAGLVLGLSLAGMLWAPAFAQNSSIAPEPALLSVEDEETSGTAESQPSAIDQRISDERVAERHHFALLPYKPNYVLPLTYNSRPNTDLQDQLDQTEVKFQISLKVPLAKGVLGDGHLSFGYTQLSFWQAYNHDISASFRETDYEPELTLAYLKDVDFWGFANRAVIFGFVHQSNGRDLPLSRSWNRLYAQFVFERRNLYVSLKPWWRIPEEEKTDPTDTQGDDNPDIEDYAGRGEITTFYRAGRHSFGLQVRNNFRLEHNRSGVQLDWSMPVYESLSVYVQYYNGYGESLVDYDQYVNRIGLGVMLSNWL